MIFEQNSIPRWLNSLTPKSIFLCISYSTGWGQTSGVNPFPPNHLQWAQLPIQTSENCQNVYTGTITEGEICAGDDKATVCNVSTYVVV